MITSRFWAPSTYSELCLFFAMTLRRAGQGIIDPSSLCLNQLSVVTLMTIFFAKNVKTKRIAFRCKDTKKQIIIILNNGDSNVSKVVLFKFTKFLE